MSVMVITGGSRGIGRAIVLGAAARGWSVAFSYASNDAAAEETAAEARRLGADCRILKGSATDPEHVAALFDLGAEMGPVDKCVVNAGVIGRVDKLADRPPEDIRRVIDVNVTGALITAREAARRMPLSRGGPGGAIVITSSVASRLGGANAFIDYAASKGAMDTLAYGLGLELAPDGVRVNAIRPGIIDTEIHDDAGIPDRVDSAAPLVPMGRAGSAEEVAETVLWLLSDAASYVTSTHVDISGGR